MQIQWVECWMSISELEQCIFWRCTYFQANVLLWRLDTIFTWLSWIVFDSMSDVCFQTQVVVGFAEDDDSAVACGRQLTMDSWMATFSFDVKAVVDNLVDPDQELMLLLSADVILDSKVYSSSNIGSVNVCGEFFCLLFLCHAVSNIWDISVCQSIMENFSKLLETKVFDLLRSTVPMVNYCKTGNSRIQTCYLNET